MNNQKELDQTLLSAAKAGELKKVQSLIEQKANPDVAFFSVKNSQVEMPLNAAAENNHEDVVKALLAAKASVSARDAYYKTPLHWSAQRGSESLVKILIDAKANVNAQTEKLSDTAYICTPLHLAATEGHEPVVKALIAAKANLEITDSQHKTALHLALNNRHLAIVNALIAAKVNLEAMDGYFETPIELASKAGYKAIVNVLIEAKAHVDGRVLAKADPSVVKPLFEAGREAAQSSHQIEKRQLDQALLDAAGTGELKQVESLIAQKANLETINPNYYSPTTPLYMAAENGHELVVRALMTAKANVEFVTRQSLLQKALKNGHDGVVKTLIEGKANVNLVTLRSASGQIKELLLEARKKLRTPGQSKQIKFNEALFSAASTGDLKKVQSLLQQKANLNVRDWVEDCTPLQKAAKNGHASVVKALFEAKADINSNSLLSTAIEDEQLEVVKILIAAKASLDEGSDGPSPLRKAVEKGQVESVKLLIGANASLVSKGKSSLLYEAVKNGHEGVTKALISAKANLNSETKNKSGHSFLHEAIEKGHNGVAKALIAGKANLNLKDSNLKTPLQLLVNKGNESIAKILIDANATLETETYRHIEPPLYQALRRGWTWMLHKSLAQQFKRGKVDALMGAIVLRDETRAISLLESKAAINKSGLLGIKALGLAAQTGQINLVKALLHAGADVNATDDLAYSALQWACILRHIKVVNVLIEAKASLELKTKYDMTVLHRVIEKGYEDIVKVLIKSKANVEAKTKYGKTPLHLAGEKGHEGIIKVLIAAKANVDAMTKNGKTPLHLVILKGHYSIVKALISAKANIEAMTKDSIGNRPLHLAMDRGDENITKALIEAKANVEAKNKGGKTPLNWSGIVGRASIAQLLIAAKANVEAKDKGGKTPLHWAGHRRHAATVKVLIAAKANVEAKDRSGETPLYMAATGFNANIINANIVKVLFEAKANVDAIPRAKYCKMLEWVINEKNKGELQTLIERKADLNQKGSRGYGLLNMAVYNCGFGNFQSYYNYTDEIRRQFRMVKSLIQGRASPHIKGDQQGFTPLHMAIDYKFLHVVKALINVKANMETKSHGGDTPLHVAIKTYNIDIAYQLLMSGASVLAKDGIGLIPLDKVKESNRGIEWLTLLQTLTDSHMELVEAANKGNITEIANLIEKKGDIEARDETGHTLLAIATRNADSSMTKKLLEMKADPVTASVFAAQNNRSNILKELMSQGKDIVSYQIGGLSLVAYAAQFDSQDCVRFLIKNYAKVTPEVIRLAMGVSKGFLKQALEDETSIERVGQLDRYGNLTVSFSVDYKDLTFDKPLGAGAYGEVTLGTYQFNPVAIKKLKAELFTPALQKEFLQEASVMGSLNSNYLVNLLGVCTQEGHYSMVMEYVPGGSLYDLLKDKSKTLSPTQQLQIAFEMAAGLACLHDRRILHRDLKSLNVLMYLAALFSKQPTYHAKLCDFGLVSMRNAAQGVNEEKQKSQSVVGTTLWMAPELFHGKHQSEASDVYALGLVIWELVTRQVPFKQERQVIFSNITQELIQKALKEKSCQGMLAAKKLIIPDVEKLKVAFDALKKDDFNRKPKNPAEASVFAIAGFVAKQLLAKKIDAMAQAQQLPAPGIPKNTNAVLAKTIRDCVEYDPAKRPAARIIANSLYAAAKANAALEEKEKKVTVRAQSPNKQASAHLFLLQTEKTVAHHLGQQGLFAKRGEQSPAATATVQFDMGLTTETAVPNLSTALGASQ